MLINSSSHLISQWFYKQIVILIMFLKADKAKHENVIFAHLHPLSLKFVTSNAELETS